MKITLVGYTGFVGGNLAASHGFDCLYNSKNIREAFGSDNGLVVYSGMPAEKFLAASDPAADFACARNALENITRMRPQALVLISTVDVYPRPQGVTEDTKIERLNGTDASLAYGQNRLWLEEQVRDAWPNALIVRLPGLFGSGIKKNFIYDMLTLTPSALTEEKYLRFAEHEELVRRAYRPDGKGFYRLAAENSSMAAGLRAFFETSGFNALSFTDSRSVFQFYNLAGLWRDITRCRKAGLRLVNLATQPIEAGVLYNLLHGSEFENLTAKGPVRYDVHTRYGRELGGLDRYIADSAEVVAGIARFVASSFPAAKGGAVTKDGADI